MMDRTKILLPYEVEFKMDGLWHPYGRYTSLKEAQVDRDMAIEFDKSRDCLYDYRIIESKVVD